MRLADRYPWSAGKRQEAPWRRVKHVPPEAPPRPMNSLNKVCHSRCTPTTTIQPPSPTGWRPRSCSVSIPAGSSRRSLLRWTVTWCAPWFALLRTTRPQGFGCSSRGQKGKDGFTATGRASNRLRGGRGFPIGQKRQLPVVLDITVMDSASVLVSGGRRGLDIEIMPEHLVRVTNARTAPIGRP